MPVDLEFTGERFLPGTPGEIAIEHWHRYAFARRYVAGKRVLDAACGEGYGTALLATVAADVIGVDIDAATVAHARTTYAERGNLRFETGSVAALPVPDAAIDVVVSFETIEHLPAALQPKMLAEFARVLAPGGVLILSSPNKRRYSDDRGYSNPFHQHELHRDELARLLAPSFPALLWFHQAPLLASALWGEHGEGVAEIWSGDGKSVAPMPAPDGMYYVVVAAKVGDALPATAPHLSLFADRDDSALKRAEANAREVLRLDALLTERDAALDRQAAHVRHLEELVAYRERIVEERDAELAALVKRESRRDAPRAPIDVVIPVYNAAADLARCVESVLARTAGDFRLVLIDDASPDPAIGAYFIELSRRALPQVVLLRNETNLGFIGTANRGMSLSRADVVLLNSDTEVTAGWLDALARCAASDPRIGTITPFSNNAEICSFPRFCEDNAWPEGADAERVRAALERSAAPTYPELPTGVGFCFYIRRALIDAIGAFDPAFGLGYGEENDFCLRAAQKGFRNVLCDDAFVLHLGGRSFEGRKAELGTRNMALLLERHPAYLDLVRGYIEADPLRPIRDAALARHRILSGGARGVLHVIHGHGGGTEHHVRGLIAVSRARYRHYLAIAVGATWQLEEHLDDGAVRTFEFLRQTGESWRDFVGSLAATFGIDVVHLHNVSMCRDGLLDALSTLDLPYGYTVHDLNFACPTITFLGADGMYCGAQTDPATCGACLAAQPDFARVDIVDWRARHGALLRRAAFVIAPSRWAAATLRRYFPEPAVAVIPHGAPSVRASQTVIGDERRPDARDGQPAVVALPDDGVPTVAVLGAVGPDKGARRLERLAQMVRECGARVRFVLIGYLDVQHAPWQSEDAVLTVHGHYEARDLPDLFARYRVQLVAYPSAGPETFSFTLSESWAAGLPVVVPPFGALVERVADTGAGWTWTEEEWRSDKRMLDRILDLVAREHSIELATAGRRARALPQTALEDMAERTLALYDGAVVARVSASSPPFAAARVRDALGYAPWMAPRVAEPAQKPAPSIEAAAAVAAGSVRRIGRMARVASRLRHTPMGRLVYRMTPAPIIEALKARLR